VVTQQYNIYSKTATFLLKKWKIHVPGASRRASGLVQLNTKIWILGYNVESEMSTDAGHLKLRRSRWC
uniref:hypothetical protein n=1 Tax=Coprococcus sp. AF21-14LB TaxID=2292231 RepID=UPI001A9A2F0F